MNIVTRQFDGKTFVIQYANGNEINLPEGTTCRIAVSGRTPGYATSHEFVYNKPNKEDNELFTTHLVNTLIDFIMLRCIQNLDIQSNIMYIYEVFNSQKDIMWSSPFMYFYLHQTK